MHAYRRWPAETDSIATKLDKLQKVAAKIESAETVLVAGGSVEILQVSLDCLNRCFSLVIVVEKPLSNGENNIAETTRCDRCEINGLLC